MRPPRRSSNNNFERIKKYDEWIPGVILDIQLRENYRTGFKNKDGTDKFDDQVRFKFQLVGHEYPHYSRWMGYSFFVKARLFTDYLVPLVEGIKHDAAPDYHFFDLENLRGMKIKTMWSVNGNFDNLEQIRPLDKKLINISKGFEDLPTKMQRQDEESEEIEEEQSSKSSIENFDGEIEEERPPVYEPS